jgi:probable Rubsico expression protein CbbX
MEQKHLKKDFNIKAKSAYQNSVIPKMLESLNKDFIGLDNVVDQLDSLISLLFIKSLMNEKYLTDLSLHMSFTGRPGTGKSSVALKVAEILRDLNYLSKGHLVSVTREDLVGQYVGHTAPKTKEVLQKAHGGLLFIDQSHELYKSNNEKDYGTEAIEIILQVMENQRNDLVLIFSDEKEKLEKFFDANPGISSRIGNHINFPNYCFEDLQKLSIFLLKKEGNFYVKEDAKEIFYFYLEQFIPFPAFANARSLLLFINQILIFQAERLYNNRKSDLNLASILTIEKEDLLKFSEKDFINIIGSDKVLLFKK